MYAFKVGANTNTKNHFKKKKPSLNLFNPTLIIMSTTKATTQKLKIKTGSCNRCFKEYNYYKIELQKETDRLTGMQERGDEETKLKQQQNVIEETKQMIPNTQSRLNQAYADLKKFLDEVSEEAVVETEEYKNAVAAITQVEEANLLQ